MYLMGDSCETGDFDTNIDWALCTLLHCIFIIWFYLFFSFCSIFSFLLYGCELGTKGYHFRYSHRKKKRCGIDKSVIHRVKLDEYLDIPRSTAVNVCPV